MTFFVFSLIINFFSLIVITVNAAKNKSEELTKFTRAYNVSQCDDLKFIRLNEFSKILQNVTEYYNFNITVFEHMDISNVKISANYERCSCDGYNCEHYLTINNMNLYTIIKTKAFAKIYDAVMKQTVPPLTNFPLVEKDTYQINNITVEQGELENFYSEVSKYYWKNTIHGKVGNNAAFCLYFEGKIVTYPEPVEDVKMAENYHT